MEPQYIYDCWSNFHLNFLYPFVSSIFLCAPNQQTTSSKLLMTPCQWVICSKRPSKTKKITLTLSYRGISFLTSSNNTPSSPPYCPGIKIKSLNEVKHNGELTAVIGDYYYFSPLVIDDVSKMGNVSCGDFYMGNHTLSQQYYDL